MLRDFRKPLVIAAPKVGLKHPKAYSGIDDFAPGTKFQPVIQNRYGDAAVVNNVIFCSGKVNFDIQARLEKNAPQGGVLLLRMEELAPFPVAQIRQVLSEQVGADAQFTWVQEEPVN